MVTTIAVEPHTAPSSRTTSAASRSPAATAAELGRDGQREQPRRASASTCFLGNSPDASTAAAPGATTSSMTRSEGVVKRPEMALPPASR